MTDHELLRAQFRIALFVRRGFSEARAEAWADFLTVRDAERDDRRVCMECDHLAREWRCVKRGVVLTEHLQRCPFFSWRKPTQQ